MRILIKILFFSTIITLTVSNCPQNCHECDPSGLFCFACHENFQTNVFGSCQQTTIDKCVIYGQNDQCLNCQPTYRLMNNKCQKDYTGCVLANSHDGTCFQCGYSTILKEKYCIGVINCQLHQENCTKCRQGYKLEFNKCNDISQGCAQVRPQDGICSKCKKGYIYSGYQCIAQEISAPRCYIYNNEGKCKVCKDGYNLFQDKCLLQKQIQKYMLAKQAGTSDTFGFSAEDGFVQGGKQQQLKSMENIYGNKGLQEQRNFLFNQIVHSTQDFASRHQYGMNNGEQIDYNEHGQKWIADQNCQVPDTSNPGACLICLYGYYPKNYRCKKVSNLCDGHNVQTGQCFNCKFNLKLENGVCSDQNCYKYVNGTCVDCKDGFNIDENSICRYNDVNCLQSFNQRCENCKSNYYVNIFGKCQPLPNNCNFANIQTGDCLQCIQGFQVISGNCSQIIKIQNCQVQDPNNKNKCLICVFGYFPKDNKCQKVSDLCAEHDIQTGFCINCKNTQLTLKDGKCIDPNCRTYNMQYCVDCIQNFHYDQDKQICIFDDPNCQKSANKACLICRQGYYINQQFLCSALPQNCQAANPYGICSRCNYGWKFSNGICILQQTNKPQILNLATATTPYKPAPQSNYMNKHIMSDQRHTIPRNGQFIDTNCLNIVNQVCIECSKRYYPNQHGKCVPVDPLCKDNNVRGQCTQCYKGYSVQRGRCAIETVADPNCRNFTNGLCKQCYKGFYYHSGDRACKRNNPLCKTSNQKNGACMSCYPGYNLNNNNGNCEVFFRDPNCKKFNPNNMCVKCAIKFFVNNNGKCSPVSPLCNNYDNLTGNCLTCYPGYVVSAGACILGTSKDPNCKQFYNGQCMQCYSGFFLFDRQCKQANPLCKTFNQQNGYCTTCFEGYIVMGDTCQPGKEKDPNCKKFSQSNTMYCTQCYKGYLAIYGGCQIQNPLCRTLDYSNGNCETCWNGYSLRDGDCMLQGQNQVFSSSEAVVDIYCIKIVNNVCQQCSNGYYYNLAEKICKQVDPLCKDYNRNNGFCTDCYQGFSLADGKCTTAKAVSIPHCVSISRGGMCTQCLENYYVYDNKCKAVSILCSTYDRSNGKCTSCVIGHFLQEGQCIFPALYDAHCVWYKSAYCEKCENGFYVNNYICNPIDRECISFDYNQNVCRQCANGKTPINTQCI